MMRDIRSWGALVLLAGAVSVAGFLTARAEGKDAGGKDAGGKYVGVGKCKSCHADKDKGDAFGKWKESKHAKAWGALATDEAKAVAKARGIDDPQKSDRCVRCHVTAFGMPEDRLDKQFDRTLGIQCEACHGPGEAHVKSRVADDDEDEASVHEKAQKEMPLPALKGLCTKCHNTESPSIEKSPFWNAEKKEFDMEKALKEIRHPNPKWHP